MKRAAVAAALLALSCGACHGPTETWHEGPNIALTVGPATLTLAPGGADSLTCLVTGVGSTGDRSVDWSSADTAVVAIARVLSPNQVEVVGRKAGSALVIASWRTDPRFQSAALVTVR